MGSTTAIAWTRSSWSPWIGCTRVSPGCDHCYAEALDKRHRYGGATHWGPGVKRHRTSAAYWRQPLKWNELAEMEKHGSLHQDGWQGEPGFWPVFPSLCDPFDNEVPDAWRDEFWALIRATPNLTWLLLTKRVGNVLKLAPGGCADFLQDLGNVWLGASIVNQEEADRDIPKLLAVPAAKRFVSYEPALGPVNFSAIAFKTEDRPRSDGTWTLYLNALTGHRATSPYSGVPGPHIDQIIVGGESTQGGGKARPFDIEWARSTVRECKAAGVSCFVKQLGSNPYQDRPTGSIRGLVGADVMRLPLVLKDRAGADPDEWPADLRVQEFPR